MKLSVVIPAYNEAKVIEQTISHIKKYLQENFQDYEIIVVDDKSTDKTLEILNGLESIKILSNQKNHGKGYTVRKGVLKAEGDWILFMDADNSTTIEHLDEFKKYIDSHDLIIGSRAIKGANIKVRQSIVKVIFGRLGNLFIRLLATPGIRDTQCGFKLFSRKLLPLWQIMTIERFAFDVELIYLAKKRGFQIVELPVEWKNNFDSTVKWHSYVSTLWYVLKIKINDIIGKYDNKSLHGK